MCLLQVLIACSAGHDMSYLFADLVKLLASTDFILKKFASWFVSSSMHGESELMILAVNTLMKDAQDPNPLVRGLALRALRLINLPSVDEHRVQALMKGIDDSDPYVRRAAVLSCMAAWHAMDIDRGQTIDRLYSLIRDRDPIVIMNSLIALDYVLCSEGGIVINRNIARHLLRQLTDFPECQLVNTIRFLMKYQPRDEHDALDAMNVIDPVLKTNSAAIVIQTIEYMLFLVQESGMVHLREQVVLRNRNFLMCVVAADVPEMSYAVIHFITNRLLPEFTKVFQSSDNHRALYCRQSDPSYLKISKIHLLAEIVDEPNAASTAQELASYSRDAKCKVS
jgi:vesicle coat complex subunit